MGGGEIIISDFPFLYGGGGGVLIISGSDHSAGQSGTTVRPESGSEQCIGAIIKLEGGGDKFGDYLCAGCGLEEICPALRRWTQSIYKHKIHQTYCQNFEV